MPHLWWTRKNLIFAATVVSLVCAAAFVVVGLPAAEPAASAALGPDWQCSRLALVFTTCSRAKHSAAAPVRMAKGRVCARLRT